MPLPTSIPGLSDAASELLGAAGIESADELASSDLDSLVPRLNEANETGSIFDTLPDEATIRGWIAAAATVVNSGDAAIPLLSEIPPARDFFDSEGQRIRVSAPDGSDSGSGHRGKPALGRVATFEDLQEGRLAVEPLPRTLGTSPAALDAPIQARKLERIESTEGKKISRFVRRGVQYPQPVKLYISTIIVFISRILFLAVLFGTPIVLGQLWLTGEDHVLTFVPVIIAFLVFGFLHVVAVSRLRCKVCSCHLLFARRCHKNDKAHRVFLLGWVGSAALHGILFRWLRCMYCGTPTQISFRKRHNHS